MSDNVPEGFRKLNFNTGFLESNGPLYGHWDGKLLRIGFRVEMRHCNPGRVAHGGMLATFADMQLPIAARYQAGTDLGFLPTINLTCDYLAPAPLGSWVEGRAEAVRVTRNLLFAQGTATADGEPCLRANGIFKIIRPAKGEDAPKFSLENLFED
ncbi:MAG: PaaI family thioesterase [Alphaproteobacteria bacterium]|nr:PaaI family thioesterase [Alphaproteobacteria bacterium]